MSASDRFSSGPGELWIIDDETGQRERLGEIPVGVARRQKLREAEAVMDSAVRRAKLSAAVDAVVRLRTRADRLVKK